MEKVEYNIPITKNKKTKAIKVNIDFYSYLAELNEELERHDIIKKIKETPQLGLIKVSSKQKKSRYDYVMLQLYFHKIVKDNLQNVLRLTYNNKVKAKEFNDSYKYNKDQKTPSIGDIIQLLVVVYNIGHFYNTFTASKAIIIAANENNDFKELILNSSEDKRFKNAINKLLAEKNYHRFHLINSLLILEKCDQNNQSVLLAKEILYSYINEENYEENSKIKYIFSIFKSIRTFSYIAYDLQVANASIKIDLSNEKGIIVILKELISEYNNKRPIKDLVISMRKLLDDIVYNEKTDAINYHRISMKMVRNLNEEANYLGKKYYTDYFINKDSLLNKKYSYHKDFVQDQILKITFSKEDEKIFNDLISKLEKINNTRVGYYDRNNGEKTILVSIVKKINHTKKINASYKVLKCIIKALRQTTNILEYDSRFLLSAKFLIFFLFMENPINIKATVDAEKCVFCTRGSKARIKEIENLLKNNFGTVDERHEVEFMKKCLQLDSTNDVSICIPASIVVLEKENQERKICEFDGLIIHPNRKNNQIVFLEAKNTDKRESYGKKCLKEKFDKLGLEYNIDDIKIKDKDAMMEYSIG